MAIVGMTGLNSRRYGLAIDLYEEGGYAAVKPVPRARIWRRADADGGAGRGHPRTICDKRPEQSKMEFALWNQAAVMQLIERQYGIKLGAWCRQ